MTITSERIEETAVGTRDLPSGWRRVNFGDVVRQNKVDVKPEESGLERYVAGEHMNTDDLHIRSWGTIGDGYLGPAFHRKFVKGQVLYGSRRTYLRKVAVAEFDGICANTTFVLEPADDRLLPELLPFIMQTDAFNEHSVKQSKGSVNPYVNFSDLAWYEFALPPKDEQRRIAEMLWAAEELCESRQQLISSLRYSRQALIDGLVPDPSAGEPTVAITTLEAVCYMQNGRPFPSSDYTDNGVRLLRPGNLGGNGYITWGAENTKTLPLDYLESASEFLLRPGDVVIKLTAQSLEEGFMGRVCLLRERDESLLNQRIGRFKCFDSISLEYLFRCLQTTRFRKLVETNCEGSKVKHLYWRHIKDFAIGLVGNEMQQQIVRQLAVVDKSFSDAATTLEMARQLRQSLREALLAKGAAVV